VAIDVGVRRKGAIADINVTPMADIMIVLLIIFMVMTPLLASSPVPLPPAAHTEERAGKALTIVVKASGEVQVGESSFAALDALADFVRARTVPGDAPPLVLVQGDRDVAYATVARVLDACRRLGLEEIALATDPRPSN
jgi:biopolymer transport protein ExbD